MKKIFITHGLILILLLTASPIIMGMGHAFTLTGQSQGETSACTQAQSRALVPEGDTVYIAVKEEVLEISPAVAFGDDVYVVVYVKADNEGVDAIYAAVIRDVDSNPLPYKISNQSVDCGYPAIAYQASIGLFVVAYLCNDAQIHVQTFSPATETIGSVVIIAENAWGESPPAIACHPTADSCLVAYENTASQIMGRYVTISTGGDLELSPEYRLSDAETASGPRLAWGRERGTYLLAYTERTVSGVYFPAFTHVSDQENQAQTEKALHPSTSAVTGIVSPSGNNAFALDAAYDPCTQKFLLTFADDADGDGENYDLYAAVLHPSDPQSFGHFPIAATAADERGGAVRFLTTDHLAPACGGMGRLLAVYIHENKGVMAAEVRGNSHPANPAYSTDPEDQHLLVAYPSNMAQPMSATISNGTQMLIVYEVYWRESQDYDIWGTFITLRSHIYLPLVVH